VTRGSPSSAALLGAACALVGPRAPAAQTTATVDLGLSTVRYDGFLASGAATVTPAVRWERPGASLGARGTYLRFESGNRSLQASVTASLSTPREGRWRGELSGAAGASSYADFATFWHAVWGTRLHLVGARSGAWLGGTAGRTSFGTAPRPVAGAAIRVWTRRRGVTLLASANRAFVGDTAYSDVASSARVQRAPLVLEASVAARLWSRGGGRGVFGDGSATLALSGRAALALSGGRYPTDPVSGTIAGRYATAAVRVHVLPGWPFVSRDPVGHAPHGSSNGPGSTVARLDVRPASAATVRLVVHAPHAAVVEIAGDFTDWQPVPLSRTRERSWEIVLRLPSGLHRIDVRVDGGEWFAPAGTTHVPDDYGGEIGTFVVP
jgi:predicted carbohydrate-binding protein with CBM48